MNLNIYLYTLWEKHYGINLTGKNYVWRVFVEQAGQAKVLMVDETINFGCRIGDERQINKINVKMIVNKQFL